MLWLICGFLISPVASADFSPKVPEEVQQKWAEAKVLVSSGIEQAKEKIHASGVTDLASGAAGLGGKLKLGAAKAEVLWQQAKQKGKGALVAADQLLHEHVIDDAGGSRPKK